MNCLPDDMRLDELHTPLTSILHMLPVEIREAIYDQYYNDCSERVIYFTHNGRNGKCVVRVNADTSPHGSLGKPVFDLVKPQRNLLHLPLACRQICSESLPILYSRVAFRFLSADALIAFSSKVPAGYFACVTALTLEAPGYSLLEDYFDKVQWRRAWQAISKLGRLTRLTVNMLDSERSLARQDWGVVLDPMTKITGPIDFDVKLHCEPDVLPTIEAAAPFRLLWLEEDVWHQIGSD